MSVEFDTLTVLALAWVAYFILHSTLASLTLKRRVASNWPGLMPAYRLMFNTVAVALIIPLLIFTHASRGPLLWQWQGLASWIANGLALCAVLLFMWSLRYYDGSEFLGLKQWRTGIRTVEDQEQFRISPLHRFVRHPWYFLALLILWTRDMDAALLVTTMAVTLYFGIGSRFEEYKLRHYHGEAYRRYRQRVPALIPMPWRYLDVAGARELMTLAARSRGIQREDR